jgi:hypothetical protein
MLLEVVLANSSIGAVEIYQHFKETTASVFIVERQ